MEKGKPPTDKRQSHLKFETRVSRECAHIHRQPAALLHTTVYISSMELSEKK